MVATALASILGFEPYVELDRTQTPMPSTARCCALICTKLVKSYDFGFGFCIPASTNTWDAVYQVPPLDDDLSETKSPA